MEIIKARHSGEKHIYVHNDLLNAARNLKELIEQRIEAENLKGIAYSYMSCMLLLAFSVEAAINFFGYKLIKDWKEFAPFKLKLEQVITALNLAPDYAARPFQSIAVLKDFRDNLAHGKPIEVRFDEIIEGSPEVMDPVINLKHEWQTHCTHDAVMDAYEDVNAIWSQLLAASGLRPFETLTRGFGTLSLIETTQSAAKSAQTGSAEAV